MQNFKKDMQFGVTSLGEKGQVVIPADIRAALKLVKGEKLIAFTHNGSIALVPASSFEEVAKQFTVMRDLIRTKNK